MAKKFEDEFDTQLNMDISSEFDKLFETDSKSFGDFASFDMNFDFDFPEIKIDIPDFTGGFESKTEAKEEEEPTGLFGFLKKKKKPEEKKEAEKDYLAIDMGFDFEAFNKQFESTFPSASDFAGGSFDLEIKKSEEREQKRLAREQAKAEEQRRKTDELAKRAQKEARYYARLHRAQQFIGRITGKISDAYYSWAVVWDRLAEERLTKKADRKAERRNRSKAQFKSLYARKRPEISLPEITLPSLKISPAAANSIYTCILLCAVTGLAFIGLKSAQDHFGIGERKAWGTLPLEIRKTAVSLPMISEDPREDINIPVLMYHHLAETGDDDSTIAISLFEEHIKALTEEGYTAVTPGDVRDYVKNKALLPPKPVIITFDDGYLSNYQYAYPVLKKYNQKATIFVIGATIGNLTSYKETGGKITPHFTYTQGRIMNASGLIMLQSHTYDMHQSTNYDDGEIRANLLPLESETRLHYAIALRKDVKLEREELAKMNEHNVHVMAYPYGLSTAYTEKILVEEGIDITFTTYPGENFVRAGEADDLIGMHRWRMNDTIDVETLLSYVENAGKTTEQWKAQ